MEIACYLRNRQKCRIINRNVADQSGISFQDCNVSNKRIFKIRLSANRKGEGDLTIRVILLLPFSTLHSIYMSSHASFRLFPTKKCHSHFTTGIYKALTVESLKLSKKEASEN